MNKLLNFISRKKITIIVAIIVLSVIYLGVTNKDASEADATNASTKYYTCISVESGDSLWNIADEYMTDEYSSTQEYIDEVVSINNLTNASSITAGTNLLIPYYEVTNLNWSNLYDLLTTYKIQEILENYSLKIIDPKFNVHG